MKISEEKLNALIDDRISNYRINMVAAEEINPMAVVYIKAALSVLESSELIGINSKIDNAKAKVTTMVKARNKEGEVRARATWSELGWLKEQIER